MFNGPSTPRSCGPALSIKSDEGEVVNDGKVYCSSHPEKPIEYFCRVCHCLVCPRCMYQDHNGHELAQLDDVTAIVRQNIFDL